MMLLADVSAVVLRVGLQELWPLMQLMQREVRSIVLWIDFVA